MATGFCVEFIRLSSDQCTPVPTFFPKATSPASFSGWPWVWCGPWLPGTASSQNPTSLLGPHLPVSYTPFSSLKTQLPWGPVCPSSHCGRWTLMLCVKGPGLFHEAPDAGVAATSWPRFFPFFSTSFLLSQTRSRRPAQGQHKQDASVRRSQEMVDG